MKIKINGQYWEYFNNFTLSTNLDAVASTFSFVAGPFDPNNKAHVELFKPLQYYKIQFFKNSGQLVSTGRILNHSFNSTAEPQLVNLSGYSLGGVLEDCQTPYESYPLESNNRSLKEIAERLLGYFGLKLIVYDTASQQANEIIEKSVAEPNETVKTYLSKIAAQKNVLLSHDIYGNLILFRPDQDAKSKGFYTKENTLDMKSSFSGQGLHNKLTILRQPQGYSTKGDDESSAELTLEGTVNNKYVTAYRPFVSVLTAGNTTDTEDAVNNALAAELQNIKVTMSLDKWAEDLSIGDIVEIQNPDIYFFDKTRMMVQNTTISEDSKEQREEITLMLPEAFTAGKSKRISHNRFQHAQ